TATTGQFTFGGTTPNIQLMLDGTLVQTTAQVYRYKGTNNATVDLQTANPQTDTGNWQQLGSAGSIYEFVCTNAQGTNIDLGTTDYGNTSLWKNVSGGAASQLLNTLSQLSFSKTDATAGGGLLAVNNVQGGATAYVSHATLNAHGDISITATQAG